MLAKSILKLTKKEDKRKRNSEQRTEFAPKVSEFTFKGGVGGSVKVDIRDLSRPLLVANGSKVGETEVVEDASASTKKAAKTNKKGSVVHKEVKNLKARQPARAPLVKHKEEKLLRKVGYNVAVDEVKKWKGVVKRNREAKTVSFRAAQLQRQLNELAQRFKPRIYNIFRIEDRLYTTWGAGIGLASTRSRSLEAAKS